MRLLSPQPTFQSTGVHCAAQACRTIAGDSMCCMYGSFLQASCQRRQNQLAGRTLPRLDALTIDVLAAMLYVRLMCPFLVPDLCC